MDSDKPMSQDQASVTREECEAILVRAVESGRVVEVISFSLAVRLANAHIALLDSHEQTIQQAREQMWDEESVQCGNCSAQIMAQIYLPNPSPDGRVGVPK